MSDHNKDSIPSSALKAILRRQRFRAELAPMDAARLLNLPVRKAARPVPKIGRKVLGIVRPLVRGSGASFRELSMRWPELAGPRLLKACAIEKLTRSRDGTVLHIVARGGAGAALVELEGTALMARINTAFGRGFVGKLAIRQGRIGAPTSSSTTRSQVHGPSPEDLRELEKKLSLLPDGPLRVSARQLGLAMLARRRHSE